MATKKKTDDEKEVMRVQIFESVYNYNDLSDDTKKLFILQDDIRRDLAFQHARADAALMYIRTNLEKLIKNETPIGVVGQQSHPKG